MRYTKTRFVASVDSIEYNLGLPHRQLNISPFIFQTVVECNTLFDTLITTRTVLKSHDEPFLRLKALMGHETTVYGMIELHRSYDEPQMYLAHAMQSIRQLPATRESDEWPFLTQQFFSIGANYYRSDAILLGGSFKQVESEWDEWLIKFESVLQKICWFSVDLHLKTEIAGEFHYAYASRVKYLGEPGHGSWPPTTTWSFTGGPRCSN